MTSHAPRLPLSLDPLIAEAKRRARQRRALVAAALLVLALATGLALGLDSSGDGPNAALAAATRLRAGKLSVAVPRGFYHYPVRGGFERGSPPPVIGSTISSYAVRK